MLIARREAGRDWSASVPAGHERDSAKKPRVTLKLSETGDTYVAYATFASGTLALQSIASVEE